MRAFVDLARLRYGAVGLVALAMAHPAAAQDAGEIAALRQQIEMLEARIGELEGRLDAPMTLKAPLIVVSDAGGEEREILKVEDSGREVTLSLGVDEAAPGVEIVDSREATAVTLSKGGSELEMEARALGEAAISVGAPSGGRARVGVDVDGAQIEAVSDLEDESSDGVRITMDDEGPQLSMKRGGADRASLGATEGEDTGLRIYDDAGALVARVSVEAGKGAIDVIDNDSSVASLGAGDDGGALVLNTTGGEPSLWAGTLGGDGYINVFGSGGQLVARIKANDDGQGAFDVVKDDITAASLTAADGGSLLINTSSGELGVWVGASGSDGSVNVFSSGNSVASMAAKDGHGGIDVIEGGVEVASLNASVGDGLLLLRDGGGALGVSAGTVSGNGFVEVYRSGEMLAASLGPGAASNTALRIFGDGDAVVAAIGSDAQGQGGVRVSNSQGEVVASMTAGPNGGGVHALKNGLPVASIVAEERTGVVAVYNEGTPVAYLNRSSGGDGGNITVTMNDGAGIFSAGAAQDGAGEACVDRKTQAGTERIACLGLGLPSAGMGK
jgi:hypothetical protein